MLDDKPSEFSSTVFLVSLASFVGDNFLADFYLTPNPTSIDPTKPIEPTEKDLMISFVALRA